MTNDGVEHVQRAADIMHDRIGFLLAGGGDERQPRGWFRRFLPTTTTRQTFEATSIGVIQNVERQIGRAIEDAKSGRLPADIALAHLNGTRSFIRGFLRAGGDLQDEP